MMGQGHEVCFYLAVISFFFGAAFAYYMVKEGRASLEKEVARLNERLEDLKQPVAVSKYIVKVLEEGGIKIKGRGITIILNPAAVGTETVPAEREKIGG